MEEFLHDWTFEVETGVAFLICIYYKPTDGMKLNTMPAEDKMSTVCEKNLSSNGLYNRS